MPWTSIKYITSAFSLIAFLALVGLAFYRSSLKSRERMIQRNPEAVQELLERFRIPMNKMDKQQAYDLAMAQIRERLLRAFLLAGLILGICIIIALTVNMRREPSQPVPGTVATEAPREEVVAPPSAADVIASWTNGARDDLHGIELMSSGSVEVVHSTIGSAFRFKGDNAFMTANVDNLPNGNDDRTIELWFLMDSIPTGTEQRVFVAYGTFGIGHEMYLLASSAEFGGEYFSNFGRSVPWEPMPSIGKWYHLAVTNEGNRVTLILDGKVVAASNPNSNALIIDTPKGTPFYVGGIPEDIVTRVQRSYDWNIKSLAGRIANLRVWNRALSPAEVNAIYRSEIAKHPELKE